MSRHSVVIPIFNESEGLAELEKVILRDLVTPLESRGENIEVILVDDGSRDGSRDQLKAWQARHPRWTRVLLLSRNFGHQIAITAGTDVADGDTVTVIDADLQDPPGVILDLIEAWKKGAQVVIATRQKRLKEGFFKRLTAYAFYRFLRKATQIDIPLDAGDFRLLSRPAMDALKSMREQHRFVRGMAAWIGFSQAQVPYVRQGRFAGETKYPLRKMLRLSWDALTGFSLKPLRVVTHLGWISAVASFGLIGWALAVRIFTDTTVPGWTSLMVVVLLLGGVQLLGLGILGEYVGRIFEESKRRPLYFVEYDSHRSA